MTDSPQILTFYSFKGGVGRSMAVLNVAYALAAKRRNVLVLDMDLEAPGLSGFLHRKNEFPRFAGRDMVDLVQWASDADPPLSLADFPPREEYAVEIAKILNDSTPAAPVGRLDIIPVEEDRDYYERLNALDMGRLDQDALVRTGSVLRAWLKNLRFPIDSPEYYGPSAAREAAYDYILIDSRTGITETGGLCIGPLSDHLVVISALNDQNIEGTRRFLATVGVLPRDGESKPCLVVASLVPTGEIETKKRRLRGFSDAFCEATPSILSYHPQLALSESIFTRDHDGEYLTNEYFRLVKRLLKEADDWPDNVSFDLHIDKKMCSLRRSYMLDDSSSTEYFGTIAARLQPPIDVHEVVRRRLRAASPDDSLLRHLLDRADFEALQGDADCILWDQVCRLLVYGDRTTRWNALLFWAELLDQWSLQSTDPYYAQLRYKAAVDRYEAALRENGGSATQTAQVLVNSGLMHTRRSHLDLAVEKYGAAISIKHALPDTRAVALINRGIVYGFRGELDRAIDDYTAVAVMNDILPELRAVALINRAVALGQRGEFDGAIEDYNSIVLMREASPESRAVALVNRGVAYERSHQNDRAIDDYTAVVSMDEAPADQKAKALVNRGVLSATTGEVDGAIRDLTVVADMSEAPPDQKARALVNRGVAFERRSELRSAINDYTTAIMMDGAPSEIKTVALSNRATAYVQAGQFDLAIADATVVIQMVDAPANYRAKALVDRGLAYARKGEFDKQIEDSSHAIHLEGVSGEHRARALVNRGAAYGRRGEPEKELEDYATVIHMADAPSEQKSFALNNMAWSHYLRGRYEDAIELARRAVELSPENATAHGNVALALLVAGQRDEALAAYRDALKFARRENLGEFVADLRDAITKHGDLPGAEEALARIEASRIGSENSESENRES